MIAGKRSETMKNANVAPGSSKRGRTLTALLWGLGLTVAALGASYAGGSNYSILVGGKDSGKYTVLVKGEVYIPLSLAKRAGLNAVLNGTTLTLGTSPGGASSPVAGGANQRASLEGCMGETLFNGIWRLKVLKLEAIHKDDDPLEPGWGVTVEVRNGWKDTLTVGGTGFAASMFIVEPDGNSLEVDQYKVQGLTGHTFPQGGVFTYQLVFYYPYGTTEDQVHQPQKFLMSADPKFLTEFRPGSGLHYSTPTPSFRVKLNCQK
jgi:hypothetical protein